MQLAEPGDFLADLLAQPSLRDQRDALVDAIDGGLIGWMEERARWSPGRVARFGARAYVAQFSNALAAVARLPLSASAMQLLEDAGTWDDRFRSMRWPNDIDLLRQFDVALAQHQRDERLVSRWFASCEEAAWAGPYWRDGLGTALLGLRKIPDPTNTQPRLVATALARFAALSSRRRTDSPELRAEFRHHVETLAVLYPRHHSRWQETWASALASLRGFRQHRSVAQEDWLRPALPSQCFPEIDRVRNVPTGTNWRLADRRPTHLPTRIELDAVVDEVDASDALSDAVWRNAHSLLARHWSYARYTHHRHYAVRTTHNLCDRLLRKRPSEDQLAEIHNWTLHALRAESGNAYVWDLWAKVLAAAGAHETSLDVRWEAVRRFPDNLVTRMSMIVALAANGRRELARHLYRETKQDFPNDAIEPRLLQPDEWGIAAPENSTHSFDDRLAERLQKVIPDERFFAAAAVRHRSEEPNVQPQVRPVLESLSNRAILLQRYFAPEEVLLASESQDPQSPTSELELIVACRTGSWRFRNEALESWLSARPASYSLRLLALSRGINGNGPDREEFARVQSAFPEHQHWNRWLGYAFAVPGERTELRQEARDQEYWGGRLSAIYPGLDVPYSRSVATESGPLRRLFEDVALANADAALPQL